MNAEEKRLEETRTRKAHWKRWGPYVSDRAWGTVREDYSATGEAWEYFPHHHARSRVLRQGNAALFVGRRTQRPAAGLCWTSVVQAVLSLRATRLACWRSSAASASRTTQTRSQQRLVAHLQRGRNFNA